MQQLRIMYNCVYLSEMKAVSLCCQTEDSFRSKCRQNPAGLPDGLFSHQTASFGTFWKAFEWKVFDIFNDHLVHFVAICYILRNFGIFCGHFLYYPNFGILYQEKSGNPGIESNKRHFLQACKSKWNIKRTGRKNGSLETWSRSLVFREDESGILSDRFLAGSAFVLFAFFAVSALLLLPCFFWLWLFIVAQNKVQIYVGYIHIGTLLQRTRTISSI
jgi:hypothetical protein